MWGANERIREFAHELGLEAEINTQMITPERVPQVLAKMHLNLNVSLYECAPMQPLESLSVGVPCLLGPHSHYFEDQIYLHSRLVVPAPDRADVIAGYIEQALAERAQIIAAYREYAPGYNARARAALAEFLEIDEHDLWRGYNASLG
jgi:glycosyltransferase involved in cell wall biosynthesis